MRALNAIGKALVSIASIGCIIFGMVYGWTGDYAHGCWFLILGMYGDRK